MRAFKLLILVLIGVVPVTVALWAYTGNLQVLGAESPVPDASAVGPGDSTNRVAPAGRSNFAGGGGSNQPGDAGTGATPNDEDSNREDPQRSDDAQGDRRFGNGFGGGGLFRRRGFGGGGFGGGGGGGFGGGFGGGGFGGGANWLGAGLGRPENEEAQWENLMAFLQQYSPNRWALVNHLKPQPNAPIRMRMLQRWVTLLQTEHTPMYPLEVQEFQIEDAILGECVELNAARAAGDDPRVKSVEDGIAKNVASLVDLNIKEREARIERLKNLVEVQSAILDQEKTHVDQIVKSRTVAISDSADKWRELLHGVGNGAATRPS